MGAMVEWLGRKRDKGHPRPSEEGKERQRVDKFRDMTIIEGTLLHLKAEPS